MSDQRNKALITLALQALQKDQKLSVRRAAKTYNIPRSTLDRRQNGIQSKRDTMASSWKLTDLEEQKLVEYILDLDLRGFSLGSVVLKIWPICCAVTAMYHPSASAGQGILSSGNQSSRRVSFADTTTRGSNAKIQSL
jgi:hypothetical protein